MREYRRPREILALPDQDYSKLKEKCIRNGCLFEDPEFPATDSSVYYNNRPIKGRIRWLRPKEIYSNPQFIVGDTSRFDIIQGAVGNCWMLAAVGSLTTREELLRNVVIKNQNFDDSNYAGIFRFRFWHFGDFKEIVIDDRLPVTERGDLIFMKSRDRGECWSPLLEKAYAKMCGNYEALSGGSAIEGMVDFTGGIGETYKLNSKNIPQNLFEILEKSLENNALMSCAIQGNQMEGRLSNGLIMLHAYSITGIKTIFLERIRRNVKMVRLRNPWGGVEWNGPWSDGSKEWDLISYHEKDGLGLICEDDGEFWMDWSDFSDNFSIVDVCNLHPDSGSKTNAHDWNSLEIKGCWDKLVTSGGNVQSANYMSNPQFSFSLHEKGGKSEIVICLSQKDRRRLFSQGKSMLSVAFHLYQKVKIGRHSRMQMICNSNPYINRRDITIRASIPEGDYILIPSTFYAGESGEFLIRVFCDGQIQGKNLDEGSHVSKKAISNDTNLMTDDVSQIFKKYAQYDMEIDRTELHDLLNDLFTLDKKGPVFREHLTYEILLYFDKDSQGTIGFDEFKDLWNMLCEAKNVFKKSDIDNSGNLNSLELKIALSRFGYSLGSSILNLLATKYSDRNGNLAFDSFCACLGKIKITYERFSEIEKMRQMKLNFNQFMHLTLH